MPLSLLGFSAWITCEDKTLPVFEVNATGNRANCWIPSKEGKAFVVHWRDEGSGVDTAAYITLDGFVVSGRFLFGAGQASRAGVRTGPSHERPFIFSKVDSGAEDQDVQAKVDPKIGMIMLRIKKVQRGEAKAPNPVQVLPGQIRGKRKPGDHCLDYGAARPSEHQHPNTWKVRPYDAANPGSFVTFVFRYRSPEFLEAQGIITAEELESQPSSNSSPLPFTPMSSSGLSTPPSSNPSIYINRGPIQRSTSGASARSATTDAGDTVTYGQPQEPQIRLNQFPGEGLFWFSQDGATDIQQHVDKKARK